MFAMEETTPLLKTTPFLYEKSKESPNCLQFLCADQKIVEMPKEMAMKSETLKNMFTDEINDTSSYNPIHLPRFDSKTINLLINYDLFDNDKQSLLTKIKNFKDSDIDKLENIGQSLDYFRFDLPHISKSFLQRLSHAVINKIKLPITTKYLTYEYGNSIDAYGLLNSEIVWRDSDGNLASWNRQTGKMTTTYAIDYRGFIGDNMTISNDFIVCRRSDSFGIWGFTILNTIKNQIYQIKYAHSSDIDCSAIIDKYLISGSRDKTLKIWDLQTGNCLKALVGHSTRITAVAGNQDYIVSGDANGCFFIWTREGHLINNFNFSSNDNDPIQQLILTKEHIIAASYEYLKIFDFNGKQCKVYNHSRHIEALTINDEFLVTATGFNSEMAMIYIWDWEGRLIKKIIPYGVVVYLKIDSNELIVGCENNIKIFNIDDIYKMHDYLTHKTTLSDTYISALLDSTHQIQLSNEQKKLLETTIENITSTVSDKSIKKIIEKELTKSVSNATRCNIV